MAVSRSGGARKLGEMLLGVDGQPALRQRGRGRLRVLPARSHAAQDDVHPRDKFARAERLGDIIVAADLQAQHAIDLVVACGEKKDRNVRGLSDFAADVQAVEFRHADIQNDKVRSVAGKAGQGFLAIARLEDGHPGLLQGNADDLAYMQVVVNDENAVRQGSLREVVPACGLTLLLGVQGALQSPAPKAPGAPGCHLSPLLFYKATTAGNKGGRPAQPAQEQLRP